MAMAESGGKRYVSKMTDKAYWSDRWLAGKVGINRLVVNRHFRKHILPQILSSTQRQCVLFPLCGKTIDMKAILDAHHQVLGIEYVQLAAEAFFEEHGIEHDIEIDEKDKSHIYKGLRHPVTIFSTDFLTFNRPLPTVDWIWDRGGLVAVNVSDREQYRDVLLRFMMPEHTRLYLLVSYYEDSVFAGPPHCVTGDDITHLFGSTCSVELVEITDTTAQFNLHSHQKLRRMEEHLYCIRHSGHVLLYHTSRTTKRASTD